MRGASFQGRAIIRLGRWGVHWQVAMTPGTQPMNVTGLRDDPEFTDIIVSGQDRISTPKRDIPVIRVDQPIPPVARPHFVPTVSDDFIKTRRYPFKRHFPVRFHAEHICVVGHELGDDAIDFVDVDWAHGGSSHCSLHGVAGGACQKLAARLCDPALSRGTIVIIHGRLHLSDPKLERVVEQPLLAHVTLCARLLGGEPVGRLLGKVPGELSSIPKRNRPEGSRFRLVARRESV